MKQSDIEIAFGLWLRQEPEIPEPKVEFVFAPPRRWRFDFAWPDYRFAVEIEGIVKQGGRHQRMDGFMRDAEKYEAAMLRGWIVYRVPGPWVQSGDRVIFRPEVIDAIKRMLVWQSLAMASMDVVTFADVIEKRRRKR